jgi:hypothetical protein
MPIYEFFCPDNCKIYSFFARSLAYSGAQPRCPDNPAFRMERMISNFSFTGRAKENPDPNNLAADDPTFDSALEAMEREADVFDADKPEPRQVARMLRKLTQISGEKMPEQMEEVMRRLEAGEALDKLEEKFADAGDAIGPSDEDALIRSGEMQKIKERLRTARQRPVRDPVMYEMADHAELPAAPQPAKSPRSRSRRSR